MCSQSRSHVQGIGAALSADPSVLQPSVTCISRHIFSNYVFSVPLRQSCSISKIELLHSVPVIF